MWQLLSMVLLMHSVSCDFSYPLLNIDYASKDLSPECHKVLNSANNSWFFKMIDASSRIPSGMDVGNLGDYGNFDECMAIEETVEGTPIVGKYCARAVNTMINTNLVSITICVPDVCDVNKMFSKIPFLVTQDDLCQTKYSYGKWDAGDWTVLTILCVIVAIIIISTLYDVYIYQENKDPSKTPLIAFSLLTNGKKLFSTSNNPEMVHCLNGLRFISMMWVIAGHRFASVWLLPTINLNEATAIGESMAISYISGALFAVDTFFFMSGFLTSYMYFKKVEKKPLTYKQIPLYYFHRLFRITPALAATFFMQITLVRRLGSGPLWPVGVIGSSETCVKWWWSFFLYLQNYVNYKEVCLLHTWYLSADMQMFILSPFLILPLGHLVRSSKKRTAYFLCALLIMLCIFVPMITDLFWENDNEFNTQTRLSDYVIGILMGMMIIDLKKKKVKFGQIPTLIIWFISLAVMLAIIIYTSDVRMFPTQLKSNLFYSFSRPLWSFGLCWIVYSCTMGTGGVISWFLSLPIFQIMGKISYSMYLLHAIVLMVSLGTARTSISFSHYNMFYYWCGDFIVTTIVSFAWVFMFEMPMVGIESLIFGIRKPRKAELKRIEANMS